MARISWRDGGTGAPPEGERMPRKASQPPCARTHPRAAPRTQEQEQEGRVDGEEDEKEELFQVEEGLLKAKTCLIAFASA